MGDDTVELVWASLPDFAEGLVVFEEALPKDERRRAARFRVEAARQRFVLGRVLLRHELGSRLGIEPSAVVLTVGRRGKPILVASGSAPPCRFNLSHSGSLVVVAVAATAVGVDVEQVRCIANAQRLARRFFSRAEADVVLRLQGADRDCAFLRIWTQKEAYLKATGLGVAMPLRDVETNPEPAALPGLRAIAGNRREAARWTLLEAAIPGAVCSVAVNAPEPMLAQRRLRATGLNRIIRE